MMAERIEGLWAALATPLDAGGAVDCDALVRHTHRCLQNGCDGVVPFGTTGEGTSFAAGERLEAVQALLDGGVAAERIALGVGCPAVADTVALTRGALGLGLRHVLVLPPYFYRDATPDGIEDAFAAVMDGVGDERLRMTLYHIPQVSGVAVPPEAVARLRSRYGAVIAGVKDSSGVFDSFAAFRAAAPEVAVTVGSEAHIHRALSLGGAGTICGMVNVAPDLVRAMFVDAAAEAPMRRAVALIEGQFVAVLKSVIAAQSGDAGWLRMRAPLRAEGAEVGERIARALEALRAPETVG